MDDRLEKARKILLHENFPKLTSEQITEVYRNLLENGISKEEISEILKERSQPTSIPKTSAINKKEVTYLESLPYHVFVNLVLTGGLRGKDLLNFCGASPLINEKCNKPFVSESGHVVPQYIFTKLLEQLDIPVRENPREQYLNLVRHKSYFSLKKKLTLLYRAHSRRPLDRYPKTIFRLLYNSNFIMLEFLQMLFEEAFRNRKDLENGRKYVDFENIEGLITDIIHLKPRGGDEEPMNLNMNLDEIRDLLEEYKAYIDETRPLYDTPLYESVKAYISQKEFSDANQIFSKVLLKNLLKLKYDYVKFRNYLREEWIKKAQKILAEGDLNEEILQNLNQLGSLTEDELDYLVYLHYKVLDGDIPVLESFEYDRLIKYE
jgi:hypothetical protein